MVSSSKKLDWKVVKQVSPFVCEAVFNDFSIITCQCFCAYSLKGFLYRFRRYGYSFEDVVSYLVYANRAAYDNDEDYLRASSKASSFCYSSNLPF